MLRTRMPDLLGPTERQLLTLFDDGLFDIGRHAAATFWKPSRLAMSV